LQIEEAAEELLDRDGDPVPKGMTDVKSSKWIEMCLTGYFSLQWSRISFRGQKLNRKGGA
jgi:hypothetical protein